MTPDAALDAADPDGRLADNIAHFARALRRAGLAVGPAATLDAVAAVRAAGLSSRDDFFWTLHCVLVKRREDEAVFAEAFRLFWRPRDFLDKLIALLSPRLARERAPDPPRPGAARVADAFSAASSNDRAAPPRVEIDASLTMSGREVLRAKDFAQMTAAELAAAAAAMRDFRLADDRIATRRFRPDPRGSRIDPRATLRGTVRQGGDPVTLNFRAKRIVEPPLVVLADISGSMSQYTRLFLHFVHALGRRRRRVHVFLFGTRLSNATRALRDRDPDEALARCAGAVRDWSGGTRIGAALSAFNRHWSRRVLGGRATVLLLTDGLERDAPEELAREAARLRRSCRHLIWLNPLLRFDGFAARARGVRALLPHVDEFRPVHSLDAMAALVEALGRPKGRDADPRRWLAAA